MKRVLVLGCGPAGLLAAHAAMQAGHHVEIISRKQKSYIAGAQYLHSAIPDLTDEVPDGEVQYIKLGGRRDYAEKIYGNPEFETSWDKFPVGNCPVWNLREAYDNLWAKYEDIIFDGEMIPSLLNIATTENDAVLSTIPLKALFPDGEFWTEKIWVVRVHPGKTGPMTIVYNGLQGVGWYRYSELFGYAFFEYPNKTPPEAASATNIAKPLDALVHNPYHNLFFLGRYGRWKKGVLTDDAYREAAALARLL